MTEPRSREAGMSMGKVESDLLVAALPQSHMLCDLKLIPRSHWLCVAFGWSICAGSSSNGPVPIASFCPYALIQSVLHRALMRERTNSLTGWQCGKRCCQPHERCVEMTRLSPQRSDRLDRLSSKRLYRKPYCRTRSRAGRCQDDPRGRD